MFVSVAVMYLDSEIGECLLPEHASKNRLDKLAVEPSGGLKPAPTGNQFVGPGFSPDGSDQRQDDSISESKMYGHQDPTTTTITITITTIAGDGFFRNGRD